MKMIKRDILIILFVLILLRISLNCAFINQNTFARTSGLAEAYVGLADDVASIVFNPAGLRQVLVKTLSLSYYSYYIGLPGMNFYSSNLTYSHPLQNIGVFGFSFTFFDALGMYRESLVYLTYSNKLNDYFEGLDTEIYSGLNFKFLTHSYNLDEESKQLAENLSDPVFTKSFSASAFTMDLGTIIRLGKIVYLGISFLNVIPANVGIYYEDFVPFESKVGISFRKPLESSILKKLNLNCDISYRAQDWGEMKDKLNFGTSVETYLYESFVLRGGINFNKFSLGVSYLKEFKNMKLEFLYSFSLPFRLADNFGSHNITVLYSFGKPIVEKKKEVIEEKIKVKEEILKEIFKEEEEEKKEEIEVQEQKENIEIFKEKEEEKKEEIEVQEQKENIQESLQPSTIEQPQVEPTPTKDKKDKKEIKEEELEEDIMKKLLELEEKR